MINTWYKHHSIQLLAAVTAAVEVWATVPMVRAELPAKAVAVLSPIFAVLAFWLHFRDTRKELLDAEQNQDNSGGAGDGGAGGTGSGGAGQAPGAPGRTSPSVGQR